MFAMAHSRYVLSIMAIMALVPGPQPVQAVDMKYCSSINTGTTPTNSSIFQSNGLCQNFCPDSAFAIVQKFDCWCSNFTPDKSTQVDTGKCNTPCPGWPFDTCGASDLFGYIELGPVPSGTAGGSTPTPTPSTSSTSSSTSTEPTLPTSAPPTTSSSPTPIVPHTTVKTVTAGGTVSLETVTVTPIPDQGSSGGKTSSSQALSGGATAGIAVGAVAGAIVIAVLAVLYHRRKKRQLEEELASRSQSHLSGSIGIMGNSTNAMASVWDAENGSTGRRSSRMMPHDPRMDPFAVNIYGRFENKSRESVNTLQDNQDYSRKVLRTTNPDPPEN